MARKTLPTPEELRQLLDYDPETGILTWKPRAGQDAWNDKFTGVSAGSYQRKHGYYQVTVLGSRCLAHRIAWAMAHGEWPTQHIDHINHDRADNRIANLRQVTRLENQRNQKLHKSNRSGASGVRWYAPKNRWRAEITVSNKNIHLGLFKTEAEARAARKGAERALGFHKNHGS